MSCPWDSPNSGYSYSPCNINFFHTTVKHGENMTVIECSAVFMEQHISNIRVSIYKISKIHITWQLKSATHFDALNLNISSLKL